MGLARTAGRKGRPYRKIRMSVLEPSLGGSDVCLWCGHHGAKAVNHNQPYDRFPELRMSRSNMSPVHGIEGCPTCPAPKGRRRCCNTEIGSRIPFVEVFPNAPGSRQW